MKAGPDPHTTLSDSSPHPRVSILTSIHAQREAFPPSMRRVAEAILAAPGAVREITISELAHACHTSETSVVRFCRALGYSGYSTFKLQMAAEMGAETVQFGGEGPYGSDIMASDSLADVVTKISAAERFGIQETASNLDLGALDAAVQAILSARKVIAFGIGASNNCAQDLAQKLQRVGRIAWSDFDAHNALVSASLLEPGDVAIGFSHSGTTREVAALLETAQAGGATTIAVTNATGSLVSLFADITLRTAVREATFRSGAMASRIAQLTVVDYLFVGVARASYDDSVRALQVSRESVRGLRGERQTLADRRNHGHRPHHLERNAMTTTIGLETLAANPATLLGRRVGMLTNYTGVTRTSRRGIDVLAEAGVPLVALFGPEHGLMGTAQAGESESATIDEATGLPVVDTYALRDRLTDALAEHRLDVLVYDMQDIGVRYWTYTWSMYDAMVAAARLGLEVVVLDRPNPMGGLRAEGPVLDRRFGSFVGRCGVRQRHGLTSGELARLFNRADVPTDAGRPAQLTVVPLTAWARGDRWDATGLPWVMPSPNIPTLDSVWAFAATGLVEGTNASEGRGTTRPLELIGAPYVDARFVPALMDRQLPGVMFRVADFRPTFHKYADQLVHGAQLYVMDEEIYRPVRTGVAILETLAELYPSDFCVLPARQENDDDRAAYPLDRLWGSDSLRLYLQGAGPLPEGWDADLDAVDTYGDDVLLYKDTAG